MVMLVAGNWLRGPNDKGPGESCCLAGNLVAADFAVTIYVPSADQDHGICRNPYPLLN